MNVIEHVFGFVVDFLIVTIGIKIIAAHWLAERIQQWGVVAFKQTEVRAAILEHEMARAFKQGHHGSIQACHQGKCSTIN